MKMVKSVSLTVILLIITVFVFQGSANYELQIRKTLLCINTLAASLKYPDKLLRDNDIKDNHMIFIRQDPDFNMTGFEY